MLFDFVRNINNNLKKKLFRREVEASFYSNKKFNLPRISYLKGNEIADFKKLYPFSFINSKDMMIYACKELLKMENREEIIAYGTASLNNHAFLYGREMALGDEINWNKDPVSDYEWGKELIWKKDFLETPSNVDIKNAWEIGRMQSLIFLGKAYVVTSDEAYTEKFKSLFYSFIYNNPFCASVNWVDSSEAAVRTINLLFSLSFFIHSELINEKFLNDFLDTILQHSVFIENNLEFKRRRGTGYLLNLLALAATGVLLNKNYYGKRVCDFAFNSFEQEIRNQVHEDGVSLEQSIPYHTIALEIFYIAKILTRKAGKKFSEGYDSLLSKKFELHYFYLREDATVPQLGDSISSRILPFNIRDNKINYSFPLAVGAILFNEGKYKVFSPLGTPELLFLFGLEYKELYNKISLAPFFHQSAEFKTGGHYIMQTPGTHIFIEAGEIGNKGEGAPGHNDIFSFELYYKNKLFITDPGSYSFYSGKELRNKMRSVRYHNSISIDNELLTDFDGVFKIKEDITKPKVLEWKSDNEEDLLSIQHYAYTRLIDPVICKRTFKYSKYKNTLKIKDEMLGGTDHSASANFIFHPYAELKQVSNNIFRASVENEKIEIRFSSPSDHFFTSIHSTDYSWRYGRIDKTQKISVYLKEKFPAFFITEIFLL